MPGLLSCTHCPFRDDPETSCAVIASGATKFCAKVNPGSDLHNPAMTGAVRRLTLEPLGRWEEPSFPPLMEQAGNLVGAVARFVASGGEMASPEVQDERLAICGVCPEMVGNRCRRCGCRLGAKVISAVEHCPIEKW